LYSPTTVEGVNSEVVVYADALDFDPSSTYLIYDAFNRVSQNDGPDLEYWDVAILDVANEIIFPVFGALPSGVSMGNPSFAQTNGNYFVLDYIDQNSGDVWIMARDLFEGGFGWIEYNGSYSSFPRYSPDDSHLIFQRMDGNGSTTLRTLALSDKITADGQSSEFTSNRLLPSWFVIEGAIQSVEENSLTPGRFTLERNYPNPFNPVTHVEFQIPYDVQVKISVTDITGREIRVLENSRFNSGAHRVMWDGRDRFGKNVSAGIYLCRVQAEDQIHTGKMLLLK
jgi:hypothetical protein